MPKYGAIIALILVSISIQCIQTNGQKIGPSGMRETVDKLLEEANKGSEPENWEAFYEVVDYGKEAVPYLIEQASDASSPHRITAIEALRCIGPDAFEAIPSLIKCINDTDEAIRDFASFAICEISIGKEEIVLSNIYQAMNDGDWQAKESGARIIGCLKANPNVSVPILVETLDDENEKIRISAAYAIAKFGEDGYKAVQRLIEALEDPNPSVRKSAAYALGSIGDAAEPAIDKLKYISATDPDYNEQGITSSVRTVAILAVARIEGTPSVIKLISDRSQAATIRVEAILVIGTMETPATEAIPTLIEVLRDPYWLIRSSAAEALGNMGAAGEPALGELRELAEEDDKEAVIQEARTAIRKIEALVKSSVVRE